MVSAKVVFVQEVEPVALVRAKVEEPLSVGLERVKSEGSCWGSQSEDSRLVGAVERRALPERL